MSDEFFGLSNDPAERPAPRMAVPGRALNSIELHLIEQSGQASDLIPSLPSLPFIDGATGELEDHEFGGVSPGLVLDLRNMMLLEVQEKFRRQIIIARELGPVREDDGPFTSEYELACMAENVEPWPAGNPLNIIGRK